MALQVSLTYRGVEALKKSEVNECVRKAMEAMGREWRAKYAAKRFTKAGAREYGFRPRQGEQNPRKPGTYTNRKLRLFGHALPLVFTGELRRDTLFTIKDVTATAAAGHARVRIRLPRKANFHIKDMQAVSAAELQYLANYLAGRLNLELQRAGARHTGVAASITGARAA